MFAVMSHKDDRRVLKGTTKVSVSSDMFGRPLLLCIVAIVVCYLSIDMGFSKFLDKLKGDGRASQEVHSGGQERLYQAPQMQNQMQQPVQSFGGKRMVGYFVSRILH